MAGRVDARALMVRDGATGIPFTVDCGTGTAILDPGGEAHPLRVLSWNEKCNLARFADAGAAFIEAQFVAICCGGALIEGPHRRAAATALALWLHGSSALPLDPALLGEVTIRLCVALGIDPTTLSALPAPEVEALWQAIRAEGTDTGAADAQGPLALDGVTRILIEPDPPAEAERPPQAMPPTNSERAAPISAEAGSPERAGAAAEAEAARPRPESKPVRGAPHPPGTGAAVTTADPKRGAEEAAAEATEAALPSALPLKAVANDAPPGLSAKGGPIDSPGPPGDRPRDPLPVPPGRPTAAPARESDFRPDRPRVAAAGDPPQRPSPKAGSADGPAPREDGSNDPLQPSPGRATATPARESDSLAMSAANPPVPDRPGRNGAESGALPSSPGPPAPQSSAAPPAPPIARFRLVPAKEAVSDLAAPSVDDEPPAAGRSTAELTRDPLPPAPRSAATGVSVRTASNRRPPATPRPRRGRPPSLAAASQAACPDDIPADPEESGARPFAPAGPTIARLNPAPPRAPQESPARPEPAGGGPGRAARRPVLPKRPSAAPRSDLPSFPEPESEAARALDSRLRALIDIVTRGPEAPPDSDRNPEAMIDVFAERLAEAASELGLAGSD